MLQCRTTSNNRDAKHNQAFWHASYKSVNDANQEMTKVQQDLLLVAKNDIVPLNKSTV